MTDLQPIKCVLVGPPRCGKTSLLLNLTTGEGTDDSIDYRPTFFDIYETSIENGGQTCKIRWLSELSLHLTFLPPQICWHRVRRRNQKVCIAQGWCCSSLLPSKWPTDSWFACFGKKAEGFQRGSREGKCGSRWDQEWPQRRWKRDERRNCCKRARSSVLPWMFLDIH